MKLINLDEKNRLKKKKKKMKNMVDLVQQNLNKYDPILDQLCKDKEAKIRKKWQQT